ncbi:hypothetical protein BUALT_Bualt07G0005800 [Buddleja alternifolia]|uniref:Uncharacterized protein n=1 Tax=Buddleja alternifolia TaxID=168488 RepID=A0AAV6XEV0_9LAMI|nr:hypothetical protein BUALT_Bualt07G0005800 [Buddleja alternifolia]
MADDNSEESCSVTVRRMEKGCHDFVVKNYNSLCKDVDKVIESEQFAVGDHSWTLCFYPGGKTIDAHNAGYASLFVSPKSQTLQCLFQFSVLNQSGKGKNYTTSLFRNRPKQLVTVKRNTFAGHSRYIKRTMLESSDYLKDDCLKIRGTIGVLTTHIQKMPIIRVPESNIGTGFAKFLESREGADVSFQVAGETFCAHKCMLAARSPVFMSCLSEDQQHQEIDIPNMEPRIFKALLWFIYTGMVQEDDQEAFGGSPCLILESFWGKMLAAADHFQLKGLKKICESRILERLSGESVAYLLHLADLYHATELKDVCFKFLAENQFDIMDSDGSNYLKEACPLLYLELAGCNENPMVQLNRGKERHFCSKILSVVKDSFGGMFLPWDATYMQLKAKEA